MIPFAPIAPRHLYSSFVLRPSTESGAAIFHAQAYIPTQPAQAIQEARISHAHEDPGRPEGAFPPPRQGAQAGLGETRFPRIVPYVSRILSVRVPACCNNIGKNQIAVSAVAAKQDSNAAVKAGNFPRSARLLRHADFERVYKQGRRHFSASITVFYLPRPGAPTQTMNGKAQGTSGLRVGFTVGRALGGAVERNRMKRRLREAVRLTRPANVPNADVVINPKKS